MRCAERENITHRLLTYQRDERDRNKAVNILQGWMELAKMRESIPPLNDHKWIRVMNNYSKTGT